MTTPYNRTRAEGRRKPRQVAGTDRMTLLVEQVPRKIVERAREKAGRQGITLKSLIVEMLDAYGSMSET